MTPELGKALDEMAAALAAQLRPVALAMAQSIVRRELLRRRNRRDAIE